MDNERKSPFSLVPNGEPVPVTNEAMLKRYLDIEERVFNSLLETVNLIDNLIDCSARDGRLVGSTERMAGGIGAIYAIVRSLCESHNQSFKTLNKHLLPSEEPLEEIDL